MRILIDIGHPAHVHYYRNLAKELEFRGHKITWTVKDKSVAKKLLDCYGFKYITLPAKTDGLIAKTLKQVQYDFKLLNICRKEKIDLAIGTSVTIAHISRISKVKSIVFDDDDDDVQPFVTRYVNPYADTLISPDVLLNKRRRTNTIFYPGYHELAYLHPLRFKPDHSVLDEFGMKDRESFFILRFNAFKAHHDFGVKGLSIQQKLELIKILKPLGRIFITTEREIEPELKEYQIEIEPQKMHSLMAFATLFIGDSQTMSSEAAMLGVPSLRCNSFAGRISYLEEQEKKYGLTFAFLPEQFNLMVLKLNELISYPNLKEEWQQKRLKMLGDKIDVTSFWTWFIDNYPDTISQIKQEPEFWEQFK